MKGLKKQVSQLQKIDYLKLKDMQREILNLDFEWTKVYLEYQSGGWLTLSLMNESGRPSDTIIKDCDSVETYLLNQMPKTKGILDKLNLNYMWVRLAKLEPDSLLWEHRDYQELNIQKHFRLHIPIITNSSSYLIINGLKIYLEFGYLWKLDPLYSHGVCNLGKEPRIHLILDCYESNILNNLLETEFLNANYVSNLSVPSEELISSFINTAVSIAKSGDIKAAELFLLKQFHFYEFPEGYVYDLVCQMYKLLGDYNRRYLWQENKRKFLGTSAAK